MDGLEDRLPRGAYFPFGAGTRKCLGDQFALLEGRIALLEMARSSRLVPIRSGTIEVFGEKDPAIDAEIIELTPKDQTESVYRIKIEKKDGKEVMSIIFG